LNILRLQTISYPKLFVHKKTTIVNIHEKENNQQFSFFTNLQKRKTNDKNKSHCRRA